MKAVLSHVRITPRKMRLVADLVRGQGVNEALAKLKFTDKRGAAILHKLLRLAIANAEAKHPVDVDVLYIRQLLVDSGPTWKRFMPRARGRASPILKKTSHVTLDLGIR